MDKIYIITLQFKQNPNPIDYEFIDEGEAKRNLAIWTSLSMHMDIKIKFSIKKQPKDDSKKIDKLKKDYEKACKDYIKLFCEKQSCDMSMKIKTLNLIKYVFYKIFRRNSIFDTIITNFSSAQSS